MSGSPNPAQFIPALKRGNEIRFARAKDRQEIRSLPRPEAFGVVADILETVPDHWASAVPLDLLMLVRLMGRYRALALLRSAGVQESRQLRELTVRQRGVLADLLRAGEGLVAA